MHVFQRSAVQVADLATDEEEISEQRVNLPAVRFGVVFEQDHVMIERAKPFEDVRLRTLGIDFHDMRLGQNAWRLGLDLHKRRRRRYRRPGTRQDG